MSNPLFTIIIPTYNREKLLSRAIRSVIAQETNDWELIIIDDGSTDNTREHVNSLDHSNIKYFYQKNKGRSKARNFGLQNSLGTYICFLDSDDELLPNYLSTFNNIISIGEKQILLAGTRLQSDKATKNIIPKIKTSEHLVQCLQGNFNLMPFCFHKKCINGNCFKTDLYYGEDLSFFIPLILNNEVEVIQNITSVVHQHKKRTVQTVFKNISEGYQQLEKSVLQTLEENRMQLVSHIGEKQFINIRNTKVKDFILTAAKYNFNESCIINKSQKITTIKTTSLFIQRVKGIIQNK